MTIGSRAADAPVRSTAEAVNKDKRDLPILVMFADVCKNERQELKMTDGVEVGTREKVRIAAAVFVSKKRQEGPASSETRIGKRRRTQKTRANLEGNLAGGGEGGWQAELAGGEHHPSPINQSPRNEDAPP